MFLSAFTGERTGAKHYRREEASRQQGFDASDIQQNQDDIPSELHHHTSAGGNKPVQSATVLFKKILGIRRKRSVCIVLDNKPR